MERAWWLTISKEASSRDRQRRAGSVQVKSWSCAWRQGSSREKSCGKDSQYIVTLCQIIVFVCTLGQTLSPVNQKALKDTT